MNIGICGYGNIGKAVEKQLVNSHHKLVGIFSRRSGVVSEKGTKVYPYESMQDFENTIDVMLMCGGSQEDLLYQSPEALWYFDIIDTFDTHARIEEHRKNLDDIAKMSGHRAIYSCGWDPGLFSIMRCISGSIFNNSPETFWGKGVSQGHSEALRNISGIQDAIQFTVPDPYELLRVKFDHSYHPEENLKHQRECYICLDGTRPEDEIIEQIKNTPNYFAGQKVVVKVVSQEEINLLKQKMFHQGYVLCGDDNSGLCLEAKMDSNPEFTAKIMLAYLDTLPQLSSGAYSVLDLPPKLLDKDAEKYL